MPQIKVLAKGARITGGIFCLIFALYGFGWIFYDLDGIGLKDLWGLWTFSDSAGFQRDHAPAVPVSGLALALLQLTAGIAALRGAAAAGGLLAVAMAATAVYRLPSIWAGVIHSHDVGDPFYAFVGYDDEALFSAMNSVWMVLLAGVLGLVMLSVRRSPRPRPLQPGFPAPLPSAQVPPQRPASVAAFVAAGFLGVLVIFQLGWHLNNLSEAEGEEWRYSITGEYSLQYLHQMPPGWHWTALAGLGAAGALLAATRGLASRGFAIGVAVLVLPEAFTSLWGLIDNDILFELGDESTAVQLFQRLEVVLGLIGGLAVLVLMGRRGEEVSLDPQGLPPGPGMGGPPPGMAGGWGQPAAPPPGYGYPPAQPSGGGGYGYPPAQPSGGGYGFPPPPGQPPGGYGTPR